MESANNYVVETTQFKGRIYLQLATEDVRRMGILRSTREEQITLHLSKNGKINFNYCWGIHCGCDYNYKKSEEKLFREDHPNLLEDLQQAYDKKTLVYRYYVWDGKRNNEHTTTDINVALAKGGSK